MQLAITDFAAPAVVGEVWHLPPPSPNLKPASLTGVLEQSPDLTRALLPRSRHVVTMINRAARAGSACPAAATTCDRKLHSVVSLAVDRGALYLSGSDVVARPLEWLAQRRGDADRIAKLLRAYAPPRRGVLRDRACLGWFAVLGRMEPIMRGFVPLGDIALDGLPRKLTQESAARWLAETLPADTMEEIAELLRRVRDSRVRGRFVPNPVFGGLGIVAGSDGDWIAGSTLVELKCVNSGMQGVHVAQLLCYHVLDQSRELGREPYGFDSLALMLPRQGVTVAGMIEEWLRAFGAPSATVVVPAVTEWLREARGAWRSRTQREPDTSVEITPP